MSVLFILIAVSLVFASGFLVAFIWAMNDRQFEDDHTPAVRMLFENSVSANQQFSRSGGQGISDSKKLFCEKVKLTSIDSKEENRKSSIENRQSTFCNQTEVSRPSSRNRQ